jgi:hypothetical protein
LPCDFQKGRKRRKGRYAPPQPLDRTLAFQDRFCLSFPAEGWMIAPDYPVR